MHLNVHSTYTTVLNSTCIKLQTDSGKWWKLIPCNVVLKVLSQYFKVTTTTSERYLVWGRRLWV